VYRINIKNGKPKEKKPEAPTLVEKVKTATIERLGCEKKKKQKNAANNLENAKGAGKKNLELLSGKVTRMEYRN